MLPPRLLTSLGRVRTQGGGERRYRRRNTVQRWHCVGAGEAGYKQAAQTGSEQTDSYDRP